jgi:hypothetical protein
MKNRKELAKYFAELGFKIGVEVGVCKGRYSRVLCDNIPGLKLFGIDNWVNISGSDEERAHRESAYKQTLENLKPFIQSGMYIVVKKSSMDALNDFLDNSLDFVFIDADHSYESVKKDLCGWVPKVRVGGIISGHDYYKFKGGGVIPAVNEYIMEHKYDLELTDWDKESLEVDNKQPCWYFKKTYEK